MSLRSIFFFVLLVCATALFSQPNGHGQFLYPERLHADVELLRSAIHEAHPDPYRYHTRLELDELVNAISESMVVPMSIVEFQQAIQPIFNALGDSHCYAEWPLDYAQYLRTQALLLPLKVRFISEGSFLEDELKGFRSIPLGSRITAINGRSAADIKERLLASVTTDGANRSYAERKVEQEFPQLYHCFIEQVASFQIDFVAPDKTIGKKQIFAMSGSDIERTRKPSGSSLLPWGATWDAESGTMIVTMRTLDPDSLARAGQRAERFLQQLLAEAASNKARTMILDLRGAGGRDLGMAEMVFSAFAKQPYQMLSDMQVRSIEAPEERSSHTLPTEFYASADTRFLPNAMGAYRLPPSDPRLAYFDPLDGAFLGKLYVICDGMTRDAAAALVMMARRNHRGRLVGEETGSNAHGFTGGPEWIVTAPNSGMRFHIPLVKYIPAGRGDGPMDRGEQPHHQAYRSAWALTNGSDPIMSSLLEMIRELE